jgi:hypothetical protein
MAARVHAAGRNGDHLGSAGAAMGAECPIGAPAAFSVAGAAWFAFIAAFVRSQPLAQRLRSAMLLANV